MANLHAALDRVRDAGADSNGDAPSFERYETEYEAILLAVEDYCDRMAFEELTDWLVETTRDEEGYPAPEAVRNRARSLSIDQGIIVPANSPLRD